MDNLTSKTLLTYELTVTELVQMAQLPDALRALADWHDTQEAQADAMGMNSSAEHHKARRFELNKEADRIEQEWMNG